MNETSIKNAWEYYIATLPIKPEEIPHIAKQVAHELTTAASKENEHSFDEDNSLVDLPNRLSISWKEPTHRNDGSCLAEFTISIAHNQAKRTMRFRVQAGPKEPPAVSNPQDPERTVVWTKDQGPQKAWMLTNLRAQIVDFINQQ